MEEQRISLAEQRYQQRKHNSARSLWLCLPVSLILGVFGWACFQHAAWFMGWLYTALSVAFLSVLIGWIFDRYKEAGRER